MPTVDGTRVLFADGSLGPGTVEVEAGFIAGVRPLGRPGVPDRIVVPAFIDLQVNGHQDLDVASSEGADWERLDDILLAQGVTSWCPTLISSPRAFYGPALRRIAAAAERPPDGRRPRPDIVGAHLEGPFLGGALGAHTPGHVTPIDHAWLASLPPIVRVVTLAPEADGAALAIAALCRQGVLVSLGHSTATYEQSEAAADAGAGLVTHLFNGMGPFHHRRPGLVGAALTDPRLAVSLIADGVHLSPAALRLAFAAKGAGGVVLVTDAVAETTGAGPTGGVARLADGTIAGSLTSMDACVRTVVEAGVPLGAALLAASTTPARLLGLADRGTIEPGRRADLVVLTPDLEIAEVWVGGVRTPVLA